jgi:hypothetical protein
VEGWELGSFRDNLDRRINCPQGLEKGEEVFPDVDAFVCFYDLFDGWQRVRITGMSG